jgi:acyl transferase domain-containing protein
MPVGIRQVETITQAYSRANRKPSEAFYVEWHATGTSVGDPIEANAAGKVFAEGRQKEKPLK